jgi:hypothetical protein
LVLLAAACASGPGSFEAHGQTAARQSAHRPAPIAEADVPPLELHAASRFWIDGSSTVNRFTCRVGTVEGYGPLPIGNAAGPEAAMDTTGLAVPVGRFDCGNRRMTEDLKDALQAERHPTITFTLYDARLEARPDTAGGWYRLEALGHLTIAGTERLVRTTAWGRPLADGRYRVRGCKPLDMTYFGITPPTKFLGAVKVHDRIEVHYDLIAQPADAPASDAPARASTDLPITTASSCHD